MKIQYLLVPVALSAGFLALKPKDISQTPQAFAEEYLTKVKTQGEAMDRKEICREFNGRFHSLAPLTSYTIKQVSPKQINGLDYHEITADITTTLTQGGIPQYQKGGLISRDGQSSYGTYKPIITQLPGEYTYPPLPVNLITLEIWKSDDYYKSHKLKYFGITRDYISKNPYCVAYPKNWSSSVHGQYVPVRTVHFEGIGSEEFGYTD